MNKNLQTIQEFLINNDKTLLINQVNDEVGSFYEFAIKELSKKTDIDIINNNIFEKNDFSNDLFENKKIYLYFSTNSKQLDKIANESSKKIIFTDYKNYKKFKHNYDTVNGYDFEKDLNSLIDTHFNVNNGELFNYCVGQPCFIYSELTKFNVNSEKYIIDTPINNTSNFILEIRKNIFNIKKSRIDIKKLYLELKYEAQYKKFSFLTL
tara:strand:- start:709 stop:1335 length:627 start_codon:yes stop_codon:yes gene_type:complete